MRESKTVVKTTCDFCEKDISEEGVANTFGDCPVVIVAIRTFVHYGGYHVGEDICRSCNSIILKFFSKTFNR